MARGTRAQWADRVRRWKSSGLTAQQFAARHRLKRSTLVWWSWALGRTEPSAPGFIEVLRSAIAPHTDDGEIELVLRGELRIRVSGQFDPAVLLRLVAALEAR